MKLLHCIRCDGKLRNLDPQGHQPNEGLEFVSYGHFGSSVFDPMDGTFLAIVICDECLAALRKTRELLVGQKEQRHKVTYKKWVAKQ